MSILKQIFKDKERLEEFMSWFKDTDVLTGEYHKYDTHFGTKILVITQDIVDDLPELTEFINFTFEQEGTTSYEWGWESYGEIVLYEQKEVETKESKDFNSLLSHLNAEDNDLAQEFYKKYITPTRVVKTPVLSVK